MHRLVKATVTALAVLAAAAPAAPARDPAPGFEEFFGCPEPPASIDHCVVSKTSGRLELGGVKLTLSEPLTMNGGVPPAFPAPFQFNERGGLFSPRIAVEGLPRLGRPVHAVARLAGTAISSLPFGNVLPLKIKLEHPLLGPRCFIGSERDPVHLDLTTGTTAPPPPNTPITGKVPGFGPDPSDPRISLVTDGVLVDNAFAAPRARGCGPHGALDRLVNRLADLPSPAGMNTAVLPFGARLAKQAVVYP